jgi:hypothetical protein
MFVMDFIVDMRNIVGQRSVLDVFLNYASYNCFVYSMHGCLGGKNGRPVCKAKIRWH